MISQPLAKLKPTSDHLSVSSYDQDELLSLRGGRTDLKSNANMVVLEDKEEERNHAP
jgi:hypothetical protein